MSRWHWHHKNGVRVGVIKRSADTLMPKEQEHEIYERHGRELHWQEHHPPGPIYQSFRTCADCGHKYQQNDMRWTGKRLLCSQCYDAAALEKPEWTWAKLYTRLDAALLAHKRTQGDPDANEKLWATYKAVDDDLFGYGDGAAR